MDYTFLGIQTGQRDYILLSKSDFDKGSKGHVVVCPVNTAVYSIQNLICEISLYFQSGSHYRLCKSKLLLHPQIPTWQRHGTLWTYYFPTQQQVAVSCPGAADHSLRAVSLDGIGLLHNASSCHISTNNVQLLPELRGTTHGAQQIQTIRTRKGSHHCWPRSPTVGRYGADDGNSETEQHKFSNYNSSTKP